MAYDEELLAEEIARDEGYSDKPYLDSERVITIGYGHAMAHGPISEETEEDLRRAGFFGKSMPENVLDMLFLVDVEDHERELRQLCTRNGLVLDDFSDRRQRALINMCFNLGAKRLSGFKKMWAAISVDDWETAEKEALDSKWAVQVGTRAKRIGTMLREG